MTGQALLDLGRTDEAEQLFRDLLAENPGLPKVYLALARLYTQRSDWKNCAETGRRAVENDSAVPQTRNLQGQALLTLNRIDEATQVFRDLIEAAPDTPTGYLGLAQTSARQDDWETCARTGALALEHGIDHPQITNLHGQALVELKRFAELRDLLADYFERTGIMDRHMVAGPAVTDRRLAFPALIDLYWKASIGCGDYDTAVRFELEISNARAQGEAMATLFGDCAAYLPFFDHAILGDI